MKTAFFVRDWEENYIREKFPDGDVQVFPGKLTPESFPALKDFEILSVFVDSKVDAAIIAAMPNLKMVNTRSTGYDHVDTAALKAKGIAATYVPGYGDNTVAEFAFGLLLNLTRKVRDAADRIKSGSFSQDGLEGMDLKGKTAGVIGTGRIGKEFIKIAKGFGMNILAFDVFEDKEFAAKMEFPYLPLNELLAKADVITIHCPYSDTTHHLLNSENIPLIKPGAYLVNTARGPIIETEALLNGLKTGVLSGAGLDVIEEENYFKNGRKPAEGEVLDAPRLAVIKAVEELLLLPNTVVTPHVAFDSVEAHKRILDSAIDSIRSFIAGTPKNLIP